MTRPRFGICVISLTCTFSAFAAGHDTDPKRIAQWVKDLDAKAFAVREAATDNLIAAGMAAVGPVAEAALGRSLEARQRAFRILGELGQSADANTVHAVKLALAKLAASNSQAAAGSAREALRQFQVRLIRKLEEGGASVRMEGDRVVGISFDSAKVIGPNLRLLHELPDLTYVSLSNRAVGDQALAALRGLKKLDYLNLYRSRITDAGLVHLKHLPALKHVPMGETLVTDAGLVHLKELTQLEYLGLRGNAITDAGLVHLKKLTNLTGLYLGETKVTDAGLVHLKGMTKMEYLRLHSVAVGDAGLEHLKAMPNLEILDLWETRATEAGIAKLKKSLPRIRVDTRKP